MKNILPDYQFNVLCNLFPTPKQKSTGRPRVNKDLLVKGILTVLKYDIPWSQLNLEGVSGTTCWRYFNEIQRRGKLKLIQQTLSKSKLTLSSCSIDSSTATSFSFNSSTGWDGKHRKVGTKISILSDVNGLPFDIVFGKGNKSDLSFVNEHIENTSGVRKQVLNMDKGYTSIDLRRELRTKGIKVNMETKKNDYHHKKGPKFKVNYEEYSARFLLERTFGWLKAFKRIRTRKDRKIAMFKAFTYLAVIIVLIRNIEF